MTTIHFIYAVPDSTNPIIFRYDKYSKKIEGLPPSYRSGLNSFISWPKPLLAPYSITYNLLTSLKRKYKVKLYSHKEKFTCNLKPDDVLLVYPPPNVHDKPWFRPDYEKIGCKTFLKYKENKTLIISPYTNNEDQIGYYNLLLSERQVKFIAIGGEFWTSRWNDSPLKAFLKEKDVLQVDMAVDTKTYPIIKSKFNEKGKRKFLYIGNTKSWKNTRQLEEIAKHYKGFEGGYVSDGKIQGWEKISEWRDLDMAFMMQVANEYDFFVNCSTADAQATTILEQMSYGFPVACTQESGYSYSSIIKLEKHNTIYNCAQLQRMQWMSEEELLNIRRKNRRIVEEKHNWNVFTQKVINFIDGDG